MSRQTAHLRAVASPVPSNDDEKQLQLIRELNDALAQVSGTDETAAVAAQALGYDDLIVYLRTDDDQLVQRAAFGAKEADESHAVEDPLLLPFGVGIVGSAAVSQQTVRVLDTHTDDRYIVDDNSRRSEMAVPVVVEGETIAVLDSEHDEVGFYTETDAKRLEDIAAIAGARLKAAMVSESLARSVTELTQTRLELEQLSNSDPLTGVSNRRRFDAELERLGGSGQRLGLLALDVDRFRAVNEVLGHTAGDDLLRQIAAVLAACVRPVPGVCLARVGGDEFCVLIPNATDSGCRAVARSIVTAVGSAAFGALRDTSLRMGISIGIATGSNRAVWTLASEALRIAKEDRRPWFVHDEQDPRVHARRNDLDWAERIDRALDGTRFELFGQPIVLTDTPQDPAPLYETLLRYRDAKGNVVSPVHFLGSAERTGLLPRIDAWVLDRAVEELAWSGGDSSLTVNTTPQSFMNGVVNRTVLDSLHRTGLDPTRLVIEVTEHSAVEDAEQFRVRARELTSNGVRLAIDDLGAGFSSIELLADAEVSIVKIAGEWVARAVDDAVARTVVRAIAECSNLLGVQVVAEGVEDDRTLDFVRAAGIEFTQGWLTGRPGPLADALGETAEVITLPHAA